MPEQKVPPAPPGTPPAGAAAPGNGNGSLLRRVERLEDVTSEVKERLARFETRDDLNALHVVTKTDLAQMAAQMATKADLAQLADQMATKAQLAQMAAQMATKAELAQMAAQMATKADLAALEAKLLRWFIGTVIALAGIVSAATKLLS